MAAATPTPSSEIIHLVTTFADALDSLPPSLTRSLSDLKELDAVLNSEWHRHSPAPEWALQLSGHSRKPVLGRPCPSRARC